MSKRSNNPSEKLAAIKFELATSFLHIVTIKNCAFLMRQKIGTINFWHVKHMFKEDVWVAGGLGKAFFCSIGCIQGIILLRNVTAKSASRT